ncbi:carbonic anhydrase [Methylomicrobium lacus]|uniref:carbonic anhydrase n=1 Tax=Methylomicrobium lacus TaxID=136992 RepID=UPI0035A9334A
MKAKLILSAMTMAAVVTANVAFAAPHWSHDEQDASEGWGGVEDVTTPPLSPPLNFPYAECAIGQHQSPVDLKYQVNAKKYDKLGVRYPDDTPDFFNSGHAVQANTSEGYQGRLAIGDDVYPLVQFHFHAPAEHVIGQQTFSAELHFVHVRDDGRIAVLGVLLEEGAANPDIQTILDNVPAEEGTKNTAKQKVIRLKSLLPRDLKHFYTYAGSLTTPPCSEGVSWFVLAKPISLSTEQLAKLKDFFHELYDGSHDGYAHGNARYVQALNGRVISGKVSN